MGFKKVCAFALAFFVLVSPPPWPFIPIRSRPALNSPPSPPALSNCSSTLVLRICVWRLPPTLVGASRSPLPGPRRCVRRFLPPLEAFNFQLSTFDLWSPISRPDSRPPAPLTFCPAPFTLHSSYPCISPNLFRHLDLQISLDRDRNHVVTCYLVLRHHLSRARRDPGRSPLQAAPLRNLCVRRLPCLPRSCRGLGRGVGACPELLGALDSSSLGLTLNLQSEVRRLSRPEIPTRSGRSTFNRVSFPSPSSPHLRALCVLCRENSLSFRASLIPRHSPLVTNSFTIRTSKTPLPQLLYNPHLQTPLGSAGNKGLITPLESALTKISPVTSLESALTKTGGWDAISKENFNFPAPHYSQGRKGTRITPCGRRRCQRVQNHKRDAGRKDPSRGLSG